MTQGGSDENSILKRIAGGAAGATQNLFGHGIHIGIGDDAAIFRSKAGYETILTCDWFLEGTHFLRDRHPPDAVGWKCLARAVSDVAAMGGAPRCFLLSLALPESHTGRWLDEFLGGLRRAARKLDCVLAGGDTTSHREILISVTVVGEAPKMRVLLRSGARPGDVVYASGRLGEAELGLRILRKNKGRGNARNQLVKKHFYPHPRLALGQWLCDRRLATAMMDLSDGLSSDLPRLCAASGVGARVESAKIPRVQIPHPNRKLGLDSLQLALHGGDDYELLFTVPPGKANRVPASFRGLPLTAIGRITKKQKLVLLDEHGHEQLLSAGGWDPFRTMR